MNHITETSPISPVSKKGEIRAEVNRLILEGVENEKLQALIARVPDFIGGTSRQNSLLMNLVHDNLEKGKKAQLLCNAKVIHTIGYVPDLAKGTAML
jgi:hypothetical protein